MRLRSQHKCFTAESDTTDTGRLCLIVSNYLAPTKIFQNVFIPVHVDSSLHPIYDTRNVVVLRQYVKRELFPFQKPCQRSSSSVAVLDVNLRRSLSLTLN